jgi:hypothetical protein
MAIGQVIEVLNLKKQSQHKASLNSLATRA